MLYTDDFAQTMHEDRSKQLRAAARRVRRTEDSPAPSGRRAGPGMQLARNAFTRMLHSG